MKPSERLCVASNWCKFAVAESALEEPVQPWDTEAVKWSVMAALLLYKGLTTRESQLRLMGTSHFREWLQENAMSRYPVEPSIEGFNATTTFSYMRNTLLEAQL